MAKMEAKELIHNILRNVVCEVLRDCNNHKICISSKFISYYLKLMELDPNRGLTAENLTDRAKVQELVKYLTGKFENLKDPQVLTLSLQHEFMEKFGNVEHAVNTFKKKLNKKLYPLLLQIIEQSNHNTVDELYKKITYYLTFASGLGNPESKPVFKEALQVIKSVLVPEEIEIFPSLQNYIKQELVKCLGDITAGIRLYNRSCSSKKGGEGIADLPKLLENSIKLVKEKLKGCIDKSLHRARQLTVFVQQYLIIKRFDDDYVIIIDVKTPRDIKKWKYIRDLAISYRQLVKNTRMLLAYVRKLDEDRKLLKEMFDDTVKTLNGIIIPTLYQAITEVFPHFTELAHIWSNFQDDVILLREAASILESQAKALYSIHFESSLEQEPSFLEKLLHSKDEETLEYSGNNDITVHSDGEKFSENDLEVSGYCCWILTQTGGALVPGKVKLGVVEYKGKFYAFSSKIAGNCFIKKPEEYIMKTIEVARENIHLIGLLNLLDIVKDHEHIPVLVKKPEKPVKIVSNVECQTDTHFQDRDIIFKYSWNIWDYKKAILTNTEVTKRRTKATETSSTHQKETHHTQTSTQKEIGQQTMSQNYTNTTRPLRYFYGLRGDKKNHPFMMNLGEAQNFTKSYLRNKNKEK